VTPSTFAVFRLITILISGRRLDREIRWLLALENTIDVAGGPAVLVEGVGSIAKQATGP